MPSNSSGVKIHTNSDLLAKRDKWERIEKMLAHDETAFSSAPFCIKLPDESQAAYSERCKYFPTNFINPAMDLVSAPSDALWKNGYKFAFDNEGSMLRTFAENCVRANDKTPYMRYLHDYIAVGLRGYGTSFTVVDKPDAELKSRAEERVGGMPYLVDVRPLDVVNYAHSGGKLVWFAYRRKIGDLWADPTTPAPEDQEVICVWTATEFFMINADGVVLTDKTREHNWGFVPVVIQSSFLSNANEILGSWAFDQTSNMLITANNLNHIGVFELFKHGNSMLLLHEESISASNMSTDAAGNTKLKKQAKGRVLQWAGEHAPEYLVKELAVEECRQFAEYYFHEAAANERDLKSVANKGTSGEVVQESGFAKMIDREPLEGNLAALADDLELATNKIFDIVASMLRVENDCVLQFDRNFDLRSYKQKLEEIKTSIDVRLGEVSPTALTESYKRLTAEISNTPEIQDTINAELDTNVPVVFGEPMAVRKSSFPATGDDAE